MQVRWKTVVMLLLCVITVKKWFESVYIYHKIKTGITFLDHSVHSNCVLMCFNVLYLSVCVDHQTRLYMSYFCWKVTQWSDVL